MKTKVEVEYLESGTFVGGEEDCFNAEISSGETCYVIKKAEYDRVHKELKELRDKNNAS